MKVISLSGNGKTYTSNVYLVLGDWKGLADPNTLIDVGSDSSILDVLEQTNTGIGKKRVEKVFITHSHSDHMANLQLIRQAYQPIVYAFSPFTEGVDEVVKNGDIVRLGDSDFEILHTPGHSEDSICLYNESHGAIFVGDFPLIIRSEGGTYTEDYLQALRMICRRNIRTVYFGHGAPLCHKVKSTLHHSLTIVENYFNK